MEKSTGSIHMQLMGEVQTEILKSMIQERFGVKAEFGQGSIIYKETIASVAEGVGHFEPLRHYAEVHLILEPGEPGSGLQFDTCCSEDELDRNWQRLILTHLEEKQHKGVLTGGEITDMKITLAAGRAHTKHTEGEISGRLRTGLCARALCRPDPFCWNRTMPSESSFRRKMWEGPCQIYRKSTEPLNSRGLKMAGLYLQEKSLCRK